jgi:hypothetical protein
VTLYVLFGQRLNSVCGVVEAHFLDFLERVSDPFNGLRHGVINLIYRMAVSVANAIRSRKMLTQQRHGQTIRLNAASE